MLMVCITIKYNIKESFSLITYSLNEYIASAAGAFKDIYEMDKKNTKTQNNNLWSTRSVVPFVT